MKINSFWAILLLLLFSSCLRDRSDTVSYFITLAKSDLDFTIESKVGGFTKAYSVIGKDTLDEGSITTADLAFQLRTIQNDTIHLVSRKSFGSTIIDGYIIEFVGARVKEQNDLIIDTLIYYESEFIDFKFEIPEKGGFSKNVLIQLDLENSIIMDTSGFFHFRPNVNIKNMDN